jgi:hypothetical protein
MKSSLNITLLRVWYDLTNETDLGSHDLFIMMEFDKLALIIYCYGTSYMKYPLFISYVCDSAAAFKAFNL